MSDLIVLTPENVDKALPDLPRIVRLALGFGSRLMRCPSPVRRARRSRVPKQAACLCWNGDGDDRSLTYIARDLVSAS